MHEPDGREADYTVQVHRAPRASVEAARAKVVQAVRRHDFHISGVPEGDARARDNRADRPGHDGAAYVRLTRKVVTNVVGGRAARAADRLERQGAGLKDAPVAMDVDPPPKR